MVNIMTFLALVSHATTEQGVVAAIGRLHITPQTRKQYKYNVNCIKTN